MDGVTEAGGPALEEPHPLPLVLRAMLIDPVGRESDIVTIEAP